MPPPVTTESAPYQNKHAISGLQNLSGLKLLPKKKAGGVSGCKYLIFTAVKYCVTVLFGQVFLHFPFSCEIMEVTFLFEQYNPSLYPLYQNIIQLFFFFNIS